MLIKCADSRTAPISPFIKGSTPQGGGVLIPVHGVFSRKLQEGFPFTGFVAATCRKLSRFRDLLPQVAGRFPAFGKACRKLQDTFPPAGKLPANCSTKKICQGTLAVRSRLRLPPRGYSSFLFAASSSSRFFLAALLPLRCASMSSKRSTRAFSFVTNGR